MNNRIRGPLWPVRRKAHPVRSDSASRPPRRPPIGIPLLVLLAGTAVFYFTEADLAASRFFYGGSRDVWPLSNVQPWKALYALGCYPALILGMGGLIVGLTGMFWARAQSWRREGLFLGLLLLLGPGLLVNLVVKPQWGRPRPHQVIAFGGDWEFHSVGRISQQCTSRSFPSGHASMGFFLMAPAFLLYRRRRNWAMAFVWFGLAGGGIIGLARIVQGRHFASDVLWSAGIVYFTGLALYWVFRLGEEEGTVSNTPTPIVESRARQSGPDDALPDKDQESAPDRSGATPDFPRAA